ncbi:MAG: hypothetical protein CL928_04835 [Deltaproteobacteria bacterium]|nr:hypothetical protein [Deltaproteobacteria bacterium]
MTTSEFAATLKREGRFNEFKRRRAELEAEGHTKSEAYVIATSEFGSASPAASPAAPPSAREAPGPELSQDVFKGKTSTLREDYQWVYDNIANPECSATEAPSCGAWGLLQFSRSDPKSFYVEWMRMVGRTQDEDKVLKEYARDASKSAGEIAKMLNALTTVLPSSEGDGGEPDLPEGDAGEDGE